MSSLAAGLGGFADTLNGLLQSPEQLRATRASDSAYADSTTILFELQLPSDLAGLGGSYLFPLVVSPQAITLSQPFSTDVTPTLGGGLFVEQTGITQRRLRIRGTTGFWPLPLPAQIPPNPVPTQDRSFSRTLPRPTGDALSGLRHLQFLNDHVFGVYGDLARNPATSSDVRLLYYDTQQQEAWVVVPMSFNIDRNAQSPFLSNYDIDLLVVDKANALALRPANRDTSLLGSLKDAYTATQNFLARANQAVIGLSAMQQDLSLTVHAVGGTLGQVSILIGSVADFVAGSVSFINSPFETISAIASAAENACRLAYNAEALGASISSWPRDAVQRFRQIETACEQLAASRAPFRRSSITSSRRQPSTDVDAASQPTSFAALRQLGSAGAAQTGSLTLTDASTAPLQQPGTFQHTIEAGESLSSMAVRFLGDARLWVQIAAANDLPAPIVADTPARPWYSDASFFGTVLRVGDSIAIPTDAVATTANTQAPVIGAPPSASPDALTLGTDLFLRTDDRGQLDIALGQTSGLPDVAAVTGLDNVRQAVRTRLGTERGTALMTPDFGLQRLIGSGQATADLEQVQLRVTQVLQDDPRVQGIERLELRSSGDAVGVDLTLRLIEGAGQTQIRLSA